ncbi:MAG: flagellar filament capping protein FliD [Oscillospiraceae bacterium]|nr:flagellar filament capping protein FliD [Oscillospiraceae bacterium]
MINPMRSQPTRMMGLASGMDTDFIIQQTLRMHQFKIDNQMRNRKLIEWRQQTHNSIRDDIQSLRSTFLSTQGSKTMMTRNTFNATKATVSGANSSAVSIRTNAGSPLGNFSVTKVTQLARGAQLTTATGVSGNGNGFATGTTLGAMVFKNNGHGEQISWTHTGATVRVGNEDVKIERTNDGAWSFTDRAGNAVATNATSTWDGTGPLTITAGGSERTLNLVGNATSGFSFIEDRKGVFDHTFAIPEGVGGAARNITVTATEGANGTWSFRSNEGAVTLGEDGKLSVTFGRGDTAVPHELGEWEWDADNPTAPEVNGVAFNQVTQTVANMAGEARLTFNTTGLAADDKVVLIRATDTLTDMIARINNEAGVSMSYDRLTDQFTLQTRMGANVDPENAKLTLTSGSNFFDIIRGNTSTIALEAGETGAANRIRDARQAIITVNGNEELKSNTNTFDFRGVGITVNRTFDGTAVNSEGIFTDGGPISVGLTRDTEPAMNAIRDFINSYNTLIARLEGLLTERKTGSEVSYRPLTDEEKQGMTDRQIEEWEAIAKKGILRNDQGIQSLVSNLRRSFFEEIEGLGISPSQIGLTTGNFFDGTGGQIIINEDRLRAALENDPDMVADIFVRIDSSGLQNRGVGLMHKIDGLLRGYVNESQATSTRGLEDSLKRVNEQIERMQARMFAEEDRLYRVFAQMETAMQRLQQQGGWFNAMLGQ